MRNDNFGWKLIALGAALVLSACGGGGGSGGATPTPASTFTVGGAVSGLSGSGLVLQNNGRGDLSVSANGVFAFSVTLTNGASYAVTISTQPTNPAQTCVAGNAAGSVSSANITTVAITCTTNVLTGVFLNGVVNGLRYQTATQSGFTNAASEFRYLPGESITFSIGGITLGSTAARARISPFDFFGLAPPSTEAALRTELASMNNITNFDRVANIAMLLVALDVDSDHNNGLDLTGWHATLASAASNFDAPLYSYGYRQLRLLAQEFGINRNVASDVPMTLLYGSLGIGVSAGALASVAIDVGNEGSINVRDVTTYDAQGHRTGERYDTDSDADGTFELIDTRTFNSQDRLLSRLVERDDNDNGVADHRESLSYTYDSKGFLVASLVERDTDGNGVANYRQTTTIVNDTKGNALGGVSLEDTDANGVPNARSSFFVTYDAKSNRRSAINETDSDANGVVNARRTNTFIRDAKGQVTSSSDLDDNDANGTVDYRTTVLYTYDSNGNTLTYLSETDSDGNGIVDQRRIITRTFNANSQVLSETDEMDYAANGSIDARTTILYTYDSAGNRRTFVKADDSDANGSIDSRRAIASTYDMNGNPLTVVHESDDDANGVANSRRTYHHTHASFGRKLNELLLDDTNADGTLELTTSTTYTYTLLSEGLNALLRSYGN